MVDRWQTEAVICSGGLIENVAGLLQGTNLQGTATQLINYEPALEGGYARIKGYQKWDSNTVTGDANAAILGVGVGLGNILAVRYNTTGTTYDALKSSGSGWTKINSAGRTGAVSKARFLRYSITEEVMILTDGGNPALKYNGTTDTLINGTGAPSAPKFAELFANRLVLGPASNDSSIVISSASSDTDFDGTNGAVEINVGDTLKGMKRFRDVLYIFCENSIFKLTGNTNSSFQLLPVTRSIGCLSHDSIQELGGDLIFLAPDGLRSIAATERIGDIELGLLSRAIQPSIRADIASISENNFSSCVIRAKSQYRLFIVDTNIEDENAQGFLGKLASGQEGGIGYEWAKLAGINVYSTDSQYDGDDEVAVFGHPDTGYVYQMESGNDFDGTSVSSVYESPDLTFKEPDNRKVLYRLALNIQVEGDFNLTMNVLFDNEDMDTLQPGPIVFTQGGDVPTYGNAVYGTDTYGVLTLPTFKKNLIGSGYTASFKYTSTNSNPPHRIDSYLIQYAVKGRR